MSEPAAPKKKSRSTKPQATASLEVPANFLERVSFVSGASASLVTVFGEAGDRSYLVPFVDVTITEAMGEETADMLGILMPLESAVHLVAVLSGDLCEAVGQYSRVANEKVGPEATRLAAVAEYVTRARENLDRLQSAIAGLRETVP